MREIFESQSGRLSCKRVCAILFCFASIILSCFKYDFDTICLMAGSCISLLGAGLIETRNIKTNSLDSNNTSSDMAKQRES